MTLTVAASGSSQAGSLDRLVADGRAIGVRVVLDLTTRKAPATPGARQAAALVVVPVEAVDLIDGLSPYGC